MHGIDVANLLGIKRVIVPLYPGITSAHGLLVSEFKNDYARTYTKRSSEHEAYDLNQKFSELETQGRSWLEKEGLTQQASSIEKSIDLRYQHQGSEITIAIDGTHIDRKSLIAAFDTFNQQHQRLYGFSLEQPVEIITLRVTITSNVGKLGIPLLPESIKTDASVKGCRDVYFSDTTDFIKCEIHARDLLQPKTVIKGPAIIESLDSTVLINPDWESLIDEYGTCILTESK